MLPPQTRSVLAPFRPLFSFRFFPRSLCVLTPARALFSSSAECSSNAQHSLRPPVCSQSSYWYPTGPPSFSVPALCAHAIRSQMHRSQTPASRAHSSFWRAQCTRKCAGNRACCVLRARARVRLCAGTCADCGGLGPLMRIRSHGETESMRRQCAVFVAEMSLAEGMSDLIGELDAITMAS